MSYPWIHESEMKAARAEHEAGDLLSEEGRAFRWRIEAAFEADPGFRAWADQKFAERSGAAPRQHEAEAI